MTGASPVMIPETIAGHISARSFLVSEVANFLSCVSK